jgi:hypothetical protein
LLSVGLDEAAEMDRRHRGRLPVGTRSPRLPARTCRTTSPGAPGRISSSIDDEGRVNEVDVLVLTPSGLVLVEIKSRPGTLGGDASTWRWISEGRRIEVDNPLPLANRKAKRLASVLKRQDAFGRGRVRAPWVEPAIFLSAVRQKPQLDPGTTRRVFLRGNPAAASDSGIIDALLRADELGLGRRGFVDDNLARATWAALETSTRDRRAGFVGTIASNSFMKREFGKKLITDILPRLDLTHVIDCSGAHIRGHGTPTAILFGRNRAPVASTVRAIMGITGELSRPDDPANGPVWSAIIAQTDHAGSKSAYVSAADVLRITFGRHPWSIAGGGAAELKVSIEAAATSTLKEHGDIGVVAVTGEDDVYARPSARDFTRVSINSELRTFVEGDRVRDWRIAAPAVAFYPYNEASFVR